MKRQEQMQNQNQIKKNKLCLMILSIIVVLFCGCGNGMGEQSDGGGLKRFESQFLVLFNTMTTVIGYAENKEGFAEQVNLLHDELEVYHRLYDIYNDYEGINNLKTINDNAGIQAVEVDERIIDLLLLGVEMYEETGGKVNIAYGSVLRIWHDYRTWGLDDPENAKVPDMELLRAAKEHTDISKVIIDREASTVFLEDGEMSLDVGSLGKGYAVEKITDYAVQMGMTSLLISVGGNISSIGKRGDGIDWKVGVQNPDTESEERYVKKVKMENKSLVTSGNYERYYVVGEKRYHHIINPDTLMPAEYFAAVSILNEHSGIADGLSTAVYNMSLEEGQGFIEKLDDTEAMWIMEDGSIVYSSGFEQYIVE